jgi:poly-beta-1,6-N-acetyl-D-glucosamine synthase
MWTAAELLLAFVAFYPVCTAALWIAGGILFRLLDESREPEQPAGGWPGVTVLVPAYNEESVIATSVGSALAVDYPLLEVLVLDDGSTDGTRATAEAAVDADRRGRVVRAAVNLGKADRLNEGFREARYDLVAVIDADTHLHPAALKFLVARMARSPLVAAVAGAPHVTNRGRLLPALQILEAASIIGLIRRTQALTGRVGVVAGVLGLFHRDSVLAVGGYRSRMATEDIDLTWRLLLAGRQTSYEPRALVGMQVPTTLGALWRQRKRWARGQGEVLHVHLREVRRWRHRRLWLFALESGASLLWIVALTATVVLTALALSLGGSEQLLGFSLAWGIALAAVATVQLVVALSLERHYDGTIFRALLAGALYPVAYWTIAAAAALCAEIAAVVRGPREQRVVWDIPRDRLDARP